MYKLAFLLFLSLVGQFSVASTNKNLVACEITGIVPSGMRPFYASVSDDGKMDADVAVVRRAEDNALIVVNYKDTKFTQRLGAVYITLFNLGIVKGLSMSYTVSDFRSETTFGGNVGFGPNQTAEVHLSGKVAQNFWGTSNTQRVGLKCRIVAETL